MSPLDALAPNYRRAHMRWPTAPNLAQSLTALEVCFAGGSHGLVEHVKSLVESVCVTIIRELRAALPSSAPSTTELLVAALVPLGLKNSKGASKLDKVLSGFNKLADALTDMRNEHGPVAHGRDAFLDSVTNDHARAFLHTGDAILSILLNALDGKHPDIATTHEPYDSFPHLHGRIDRSVRVDVHVDEDGDSPVVVVSVATGHRAESVELRIEPSRLLYGVDREAYIDILKSTHVASDTLPTASDQEPPESTPPAPPDIGLGKQAQVQSRVATAYSGILNTHRPGVTALLIDEGIDPSLTGLMDSLLAAADEHMGFDWKQRVPLQARQKVAFKRILVQAGNDAKRSEAASERLVSWLRIHGPELVVKETID